MTATPLPSNALSRTPLADPTPAACDAANGNITPNSGATVYRISNTDTASHTVTFTTIPEQDGLPLDDFVITVAASATVWQAGFDQETFGAQMTYLANSALVKVTPFEP